MTGEVENLILAQLREIRTTLESQDLHFADLCSEFDEMRKNMGELRTYVYYSIGLGTTIQLKTQGIEGRLAGLEKLRTE